MSQVNTRDIVLLGPTTATTNSTGPDCNLIQGWQAAIVILNISAASGTSPTLDVKVQDKLPQPAATDTSALLPTGTAIYDDLLAYTQQTTTGTRIIRAVTSPLAAGTPSTSGSLAVGADYAQLDGTLTAGNYRLGPIGGQWRVKFVVGGTSPSFTFSVTAQLIPFST